jgi:heme/copper-type cytochrome/quinol oxidase subunit 1
VAGGDGFVCRFIIARWLELYFHYSQYANKGYEHDEIAPYDLGLIFTAILGVLSFPVLLSGFILLLFDRNLGTSFYLSDIFISQTGQALANEGGSAILYQHLFWFLGHPEVYIIILPSMGIVSEVLAVNSRKPIFGYMAMVGSLFAITILRLSCLGASHVCNRVKSFPRIYFRSANAADRSAISYQGI